MSKPLFILAGNGTYQNRGCEAIVRGTEKIIGLNFDSPQFVSISYYQNNTQLIAQQEKDKERILHFPVIKSDKRFDALWFAKRLRNVFSSKFERTTYRNILPFLEDTRAILSVGGDNYSLDYGRPDYFTVLDDFAIRYKKPIIIWGASVGPFTKLPRYEEYMKKHLKKITAIFVRETATLDYLNSIGVRDNVHLVADPAFVMDPRPPEKINFILEPGSIGLNLSPLMANYITGGNREEWLQDAANIIKVISRSIKTRIYLIPHVTSPHDDDYTFLSNACSIANIDKEQVVLVPPVYDAAEFKWIISHFSLFAGARTHSTIAAISSGVPTLSFAYSTKAKGINKDIFGHEEYMLNPDEMISDHIVSKIKAMLADKISIREKLSKSLPGLEVASLSAGKKLKGIIG